VRRALRRILNGRACLPLSSPSSKPECDLPLILFNELPINEGNSRQRWKRFVIRDLRLSIRCCALSFFFSFSARATPPNTPLLISSAEYFAKSWYPAKWNNYSGRQDRLKTTELPLSASLSSLTLSPILNFDPRHSSRIEMHFESRLRDTTAKSAATLGLHSKWIKRKY